MVGMIVREDFVRNKYAMRYRELFEAQAFYLRPGTLPDNVTDLRDPARSIYDDRGRDRTMLVFTKDGGVILYYWGDDNTMEWKELYNFVDSKRDQTIQTDITDFYFAKNCFCIDRNTDSSSWSGNRNVFSDITAAYAQRLLKYGLAKPSTRIAIGNWARAGEDIKVVGRAAKIAERETDQTPSRIVVYHGTSTARLPAIMRDGLKPLPNDERVWNGKNEDKKTPHRAHCVYLTASREQAEYYARKAVKVDKLRFGPTAKRNAARREYDLQQNIASLNTKLADLENPNGSWMFMLRYRGEEDQADAVKAQKTGEYQEALKAAKIELQKVEALASLYREEHQTPKPVLLQVTLGTADMNRLWADDDFLRKTPDADPKDWMRSLKNFSQIAYSGTIPPSRIKVID